MQSQLADLVRFRETCRAFMISAEETGFHTAGGLYKPNNIFVDFGRAHYLENQHEMVNIAHRLLRPRRGDPADRGASSTTRTSAPSSRRR